MHNISSGRPANQSSVLPASPSTSETNARIANNIDQDSTNYMHTNLEINPWWQVDLEDIYFINRVFIKNRPEYQERLTNFTLLSSLDGKKWKPFFKKSDIQTFDDINIEVDGFCVAQYIRLQLNGTNYLHICECSIFGSKAQQADAQQMIANDQEEKMKAETIKQKALRLPENRVGHITQIGELFVFVDEERYGPVICAALDDGGYEGYERDVIPAFVVPGDRVLEVGTAVGLLTMTAAAIVGAHRVATFDGNPSIVEDARANFSRNGLDRINSNVGVLINRKNYNSGDYVEFHVNNFFVASRLATGQSTAGIEQIVKVKTYCLEDEIEKLNANVLICDIEGAEVDLLMDADLSGIRLIIMETHYAIVGENKIDLMIRHLEMQGFAIHLGRSGMQVVVMRRTMTDISRLS